MPRLAPLVLFCVAFALLCLINLDTTSLNLRTKGASIFNDRRTNTNTTSNITASSRTESKITPINVAPIQRTYTKQARNGVHHGSGLDGPASLALEVASYRRIGTRCTEEQRRHFPSIVNYVPGRHLIQTNAGEIIWRFVFRKGYDGATGEYGITKGNAVQQIDFITDCLQRAGIYHLDINTPPQYCKNVAIDIDTTSGDPQPMISLIDFDLAAFEGDSDDQMARSQKLQDSVRGRNRSEYSAETSEEILKCVLGERDDDILSIKPGYVRKEKKDEIDQERTMEEKIHVPPVRQSRGPEIQYIDNRRGGVVEEGE